MQSMHIDFNFEGLQKSFKKAKDIFQGEGNLEELYEKYLESYYELIDILSASGAKNIKGAQKLDNQNLLKEIEKTVLNQNDIISDLKSILNNEFDNDLIQNLKNTKLNTAPELMSKLEQYSINYEKFFNKFNDAVDFLEEAGSSFRNEKVLHQFLLQTDSSLQQIFLNEEVMRGLRRDRSMFKLQVSATKNKAKEFITYTDGKFAGRIKDSISLKTRQDLLYSDVMASMDRAYGAADPTKRLYVISNLDRYDSNTILNQLYGKQLLNDKGNILKLGRLNEIMEHAILQQDPQAYINSLQQNQVMPLDTLSWLFGGDQTFTVNGQRYYLSQKSIDFRHRIRDNTDLSGIGFSFSRFSTLLSAGNLFTDYDLLEETLINNWQDSMISGRVSDNFISFIPGAQEAVDAGVDEVYGVLYAMGAKDV